MRASNLGDSAEALYMNLSQMPLTRARCYQIGKDLRRVD
jgi:hypothetical protein